MSIITLDYFNRYASDQAADTDSAALKTDLIATAQDMIEAWIGYPIASTAYVFDENAIYKNYIKLKAPPITITVVKVSGTETKDYTIKGEYIYFDTDVIGLAVYVEYTGGIDTVPAAMKIVCCKIATLLLMETDKRIGVTGTSLPDGNGHQYINYTAYTKHLKPISKYRILPI